MGKVSVIVVGSLNTDIVLSDVTGFPKPGHFVYADHIMIGPGGKSRNMAAMAGQTFTIIRAPSVTGTFSSVVDTSGALQYEVKYYADRVDIVITTSSDILDNSLLANTGDNRQFLVLSAFTLLIIGRLLLKLVQSSYNNP